MVRRCYAGVTVTDALTRRSVEYHCQVARKGGNAYVMHCYFHLLTATRLSARYQCRQDAGDEMNSHTHIDEGRWCSDSRTIGITSNTYHSARSLHRVVSSAQLRPLAFG